MFGDFFPIEYVSGEIYEDFLGQFISTNWRFVHLLKTILIRSNNTPHTGNINNFVMGGS